MIERTLRTRVAPSLALLVGIALGFALDRELATGRETTSPMRAATEEPQPKARAANNDSTDGETDTPSDASTDASRVEDAARRFAEARLDPALLDRPVGRITGIVQTPSGEPVAGVSLNAESAGPGYFPIDFAGESDFDEYIASAARSHQNYHRRRARAVSDSTGRFELDVGSGKHEIRGSRRGFKVEDREGVEAGDEITLLADPQAILELRLVDARGGEVPESMVLRASTARLSTSWNWSRERPEKTVQPGIWTIRVDEKGFRSDAIEVRAKAGEHHVAELEYEVASSIELQIPVADNEWSRRVVGHLLPLAEGVDGTEEDLFRAERRSTVRIATPEELAALSPTDQARRDPPRTSFENLAPGRYLVGVSRQGSQKVADSRIVELGASGNEIVELRLPALPANQLATAIALKPDGTSLGAQHAGLSWTLVVEGEKHFVRSHFDRDSWSLLLDADSARAVAETGNATLAARSSKWGHASAPFVAQGQTVVRFLEPAFIEFELPRIEATSRRVQIQLRPEFESQVPLEQSASVSYYFEAGDRVKRVGPIEPGLYALSIKLGFALRIGRQLVRVSPGENRIPVELPELSSFSIANSTAAEGFYRLYPLGKGRGGFDFSDDQQSFGALPAGRYRILAAIPNHEEIMDVELPGPASIPWNGSPITGLMLRESTPSLEGSILQFGDILRAVNGKPVETMVGVGAALSAKDGEPAPTLTIERGGRRVTLIPTQRELQELRRHVTSLLPVAD